MKTEIYKDYKAFLERDNKTLNGVTQVFADENPGWEVECGNVACWNCSGCSDCSGCFDCSDCSDCFDCSGCSGCSRCSDCFDCSGCSRCSDCFDCSGCSGCFDCSGCSDCSDCSDCFDCSGEAVKSPLEVPIIENIHQRVLEAVEQPGALNMGDWHTCDTTHCRAGLVVQLAGESGKRLEDETSTLFAAMQIYHTSSPNIVVHPTRFFENDDVAMTDIRRCAEEEKASLSAIR